MRHDKPRANLFYQIVCAKDNELHYGIFGENKTEMWAYMKEVQAKFPERTYTLVTCNGRPYTTQGKTWEQILEQFTELKHATSTQFKESITRYHWEQTNNSGV